MLLLGDVSLPRHVTEKEWQSRCTQRHEADGLPHSGGHLCGRACGDSGSRGHPRQSSFRVQSKQHVYDPAAGRTY